mgnify:CR=1 FL=1
MCLMKHFVVPGNSILGRRIPSAIHPSYPEAIKTRRPCHGSCQKAPEANLLARGHMRRPREKMRSITAFVDKVKLSFCSEGRFSSPKAPRNAPGGVPDRSREHPGTPSGTLHQLCELPRPRAGRFPRNLISTNQNNQLPKSKTQNKPKNLFSQTSAALKSLQGTGGKKQPLRP